MYICIYLQSQPYPKTQTSLSVPALVFLHSTLLSILMYVLMYIYVIIINAGGTCVAISASLVISSSTQQTHQK